MSKVAIDIPELKKQAIEQGLNRKGKTLQSELEAYAETLFLRHVPKQIREFIDPPQADIQYEKSEERGSAYAHGIGNQTSDTQNS